MSLVLAAAAAWLVAAPGPAGGALPGANGKIAFSNTPVRGSSDIWVMDADGGNGVQLTTDPAIDTGAAWSPDGTKIAFQSFRNGNWDVFVMSADGSDQRPLTTDQAADLGPAWSPDGTTIAFDRAGQIWVMNADGSNQQPITGVGGNNAAAWSPDGTKIVFSGQRTINSQTHRDLYVMNPDGSGETRLTTNDSQITDTVPAWSPDGTRIVFRRSTLGQQDGEIWVMDSNGQNEVNITSTPAQEDSPEWSPDGTKIAFSGGAEVNVANADGTNRVAITTDPGTDGSPSWQRVAPLNQTSPSIPTTATDGTTITCDPGTWSGSSSFAYQWLRDGGAITGATSSTYTLTTEDVGASIVCRVTATNAIGSASADSNALVPSAAPLPPVVDEPTTTVVEPPPEERPPADAQPTGSAAPLTIEQLNATDPPTLGKDVNVAPEKGEVFVSVPAGTASVSQSVPGLKGREFVPLEEARQIPMRSILDTRRGTVRLFTARNRRATRLQPGSFGAGVFQVTQSRRSRARGLTTLRLKGLAARFRSCRQGKEISGERAAAARLSRRTIRRLRAKAKGRYRTRGRRSAATVRGTTWITTDSCAGTLTKVKRGKVAVRDFRLKKTVVLKRGKSYLARAPAR